MIFKRKKKACVSHNIYRRSFESEIVNRNEPKQLTKIDDNWNGFGCLDRESQAFVTHVK